MFDEQYRFLLCATKIVPRIPTIIYKVGGIGVSAVATLGVVWSTFGGVVVGTAVVVDVVSIVGFGNIFLSSVQFLQFTISLQFVQFTVYRY